MKNIHLLPTDKPTGLFESKSGVLHYSIMNKVRTGLLRGYHVYITYDEEIKPNTYCLINGVLCKTEIREGKIVSRQLTGGGTMDICKSEYLEIILTTDPDLIADGVQEIDGDFLEQFVQNPTCEEVDILKLPSINGWSYIIMKRVLPLDNEDFREEPKCTCKEHDPYCCQVHGTCPTCVKQEEPKPIHEQIIEHCGGEEKFKEIAGLKPKQETLEEAAWRYNPLKKLDGESIRHAFIEGGKWMGKRMFSEEDFKLFARQYYREIKLDKSNLLWDDLADKCLEQFKKK
jgi:hypothetical protein